MTPRELPTSYIVLDTETTGIHAAARMIEVAAVKVRDGVIVDQRAQFCDPGQPLPPFITGLTGITDAMLRGRATAAQVLPRLVAFCEGLPVIGHNIAFDMRILRHEAALCGQPLPLTAGPDTVRLARERLPGLPSYSLHALVDHLRIEQRPAHRALADVYATQALYELLKTLPPQ